MSDLLPTDLRALFDATPGAFLILAPDLRIVAASGAYLVATMRTEEELIGRYLFDAFPDSPGTHEANGVVALATSLERVLVRARVDELAAFRYDIPVSSGGFEERYWKPRNAPFVVVGGKVGYLIHQAVDVTSTMPRRRAGPSRVCTCRISDPGALDVCRRCGGLCQVHHHQGRYRLRDVAVERIGRERREALPTASLLAAPTEVGTEIMLPDW